MLRCVAIHQNGGADLIQRRHRQRHPDHRVQQPCRNVHTQPGDQIIAPQHADRAQQPPQNRVLQADIAVQIEFFAGVIPPFAVVQAFQQLCGEPFHHCSIGHTGEKQVYRLGAQVAVAHRQKHGRSAVDKAERSCRRTAVGKALAFDGGSHRLAYPAQKGIDQVDRTQRIKIQCHKSPLSPAVHRFSFDCTFLTQDTQENT